MQKRQKTFIHLAVTCVIVVSAACGTTLVACGNPPPAVEPATPTQPAPAPTPPSGPSPKASAGEISTPPMPAGPGAWVVDGKETKVQFTIVSNSAGPITGTFSGVFGGIDAASKIGVFGVDLTTLVTINKDGAGNPMRDQNVIEAFFAARPFANATLRPAVEAAWKKIAGQIATGVPSAKLVVSAFNGWPDGALKVGQKVDVALRGKLVLWDSIEVPVEMPTTVEVKTSTHIVVKGTQPVAINLEKLLGAPLRDGLYATMLAAGCAHQPGISSDISIEIPQVVLRFTPPLPGAAADAAAQPAPKTTDGK